MPSDYKTSLYSRLWTLLEASADVTALVKVGNRVKLTGDGWLRESLRVAPADFPNLKVSPGRATHSAWAKIETLAQESLTFDTELSDWPVVRTWEFVLTIASDKLKIGEESDPLEEAVQAALLIAGPRLGLSYVTSWGPIASKQEFTDRNEAKGTVRLVTTLTVPVTAQFSGRDLVTGA